MKQFKKFLALSLYQWRLIGSAMILLPVIKLFINLFGFKKIYNWILNSSLNNHLQIETDISQVPEAQKIARMINIASTYGFYRANCLTKSLFLILILKKRNIPCQLVLGVKNQKNIEKNDFGAHAWVESLGKVVNDRSNISEQFKAFPLI